MIYRIIIGCFIAITVNEYVSASLDNVLLKYNFKEQQQVVDNRPYIEQLIDRMELKYKIPHGLLFAIALTESGQYDKVQKKSMPWPWTVNAHGKSYYLRTKQDAIRKVISLQKNGIRCIDVGCMQVNLMFHNDAFKTLHDAFSPERNIEYAAKLLRNIYDKTKSWQKATCYYHSKNEQFYKNYYSKVSNKYNMLSKIPRKMDRIMYYLCMNNHLPVNKYSSIDEAINSKLHKLVLAHNKSRFRYLMK